MVILMLLIVSSSVIELLQSFLPVPEMISSAALAMVVAIFIGWEERIMTNLMREEYGFAEVNGDGRVNFTKN